MLQILLLPDVFLYTRTHPPPISFQDFAGATRMTHQKHTQTNSTETHTDTHPHTHLSWRRWVLPAAHWGWLGSLHPLQPEGELSAGGQSGCVGGGALPRCGCQPQGELLNTGKQRAHTRADEMRTCCDFSESAWRSLGACLWLRRGTRTLRGSGDGALALVEELGGEGEPQTARTQDCQHDTHTQPCSHLKHRERREKHTGEV